jgi:hypothetical protein
MSATKNKLDTRREELERGEMKQAYRQRQSRRDAEDTAKREPIENRDAR